DFHGFERLAHDHARGIAPAVLLQRAIVDLGLALTRNDAHPGRGSLAAASADVLSLSHVLACHFKKIRCPASGAAAPYACVPARHKPSACGTWRGPTDSWEASL